MATNRWRVFRLGVVLAVVPMAATAYHDIGLAQQASKMRFDIVSITSFSPVTIEAGGVAFASAQDGSYIKLKGSGTFGPRETDPVSGGSEWESFDVGNKSTGKGKYTVTGLVGFLEAPGTGRPTAVNRIGKGADERAGLAVLRIAYTNADGSGAGTGVLVVGCHLPVGSPVEIFEGVIASKGYVMYFNHAPAMPGVDANRTLFHRQ